MKKDKTDKYFLIPIIITCVYGIGMVVGGVPIEIIYGLLPILFLGHSFGFVLAKMHTVGSNKKRYTEDYFDKFKND